MTNYLFVTKVSSSSYCFEDGSRIRSNSILCFDNIESALTVINQYLPGRDAILVYDNQGNYIEYIDLGLIDSNYMHYFQSEESFNNINHAYRVDHMERSLLYGTDKVFPNDTGFRVGGTALGDYTYINYGNPVGAKDHLVRVRKVSCSKIRVIK